MLTHLGLSNFKCFANLELDFAPITLLCGLNGMGKSSAIQALLVLRQSYELRVLREGMIALGGRLADIGTGRDALFDGAETDVIEFSLRRDDVTESCVSPTITIPPPTAWTCGGRGRRPTASADSASRNRGEMRRRSAGPSTTSTPSESAPGKPTPFRRRSRAAETSARAASMR